jgi:hypothetical protein
LDKTQDKQEKSKCVRTAPFAEAINQSHKGGLVLKKIGISLAVISLSTVLLAGCGVNNNNDNNNGVNGNNGNNGNNGMTTRSYHNGNRSLLGNGNHRNNNDRGNFTPLNEANNNGNAGGNNAEGQKKFKDVPSDQWFTDNVQWGADNGVIEGFPDGSFRPNKPITRAEVIKIFNTMADRGFFNTPKTETGDATPGTEETPTPTPDTAGTTDGGTTDDTTGDTAGDTATAP